MDLTVSPCKDFYAYANALDKVRRSPVSTPLYGVNQEIDNRNFKPSLQAKSLEASAKSWRPPRGSVVQRVGDFFASGMDEAAIDRAGLQPLEPG